MPDRLIVNAAMCPQWELIIGRPHTKRADAFSHVLVAQCFEEGADGWPVLRLSTTEEIVFLRRDRQEGEAIQARHRFDRKAPIGPRLRNCGGNGIVRFRLVGVAGRAGALQLLVDQDACARTGIAVDHQAIAIGQGCRDRLIGGLALEADIAGAIRRPCERCQPFTNDRPSCTRCVL